MVAELPGVVVATGAEDMQGVDGKVSSLIKKFIIPIDRIRSLGRPPTGGDQFANLDIDTITPMESRAHAFLRYIGMPVATSGTFVNAAGETVSISFYSPGFDPEVKEGDKKRKAVDSKVDSSTFKSLMDKRENTPQNYRKIFERQDMSSTIAALVLRITKPFNVIGSSSGSSPKDPFDNDQQSFEVNKRVELVADFRKENSQLGDKIDAASSFLKDTPVGANFSTGVHILKPFVVNPRLANNVHPKTRIICAPFLKDKTATKISNTQFLQRPGIELIIRERLKDTIPDEQFLQDLKKVIGGESSPNVATGSVDTQTLVSTILALADENDISNKSNTETIQGLTSNEVIAVFTLIRTIKKLIDRLNKAICKISEAKAKINWIPVPSQKGPSDASIRPTKVSLFRTQTTAQTEIDKRILQLTVEKINAEANKVPDNIGNNFASPFEATPRNSNLAQINRDLKKEKGKRNRLANEANIAMGDIDNITGETEGLGLIDILSVYVALWAMDITCLLGLIDERAIERMKESDKRFANDNRVANRNKDVSRCLQEFERNLKNVLSFADKELARQRGNPINEDGGTPV